MLCLTLPAHPVAGYRTASVTNAPCPAAVTARRGVRQHAKGVRPTAIHLCGHTGARRHPGHPTPRRRRAGHHSAPDPTGVPLAHPARAPGGDEYRIDAADHRCATRDPDPGRLDALPTELEETFSAGEIAHAAPQVAPGPGDVALVQTPGVGLLLVQEAIGESVLAVSHRRNGRAERDQVTALWLGPVPATPRLPGRGGRGAQRPPDHRCVPARPGPVTGHARARRLRLVNPATTCMPEHRAPTSDVDDRVHLERRGSRPAAPAPAGPCR